LPISMFLAPAYWRQLFRSWVAQVVRAVHEAGLPVIWAGREHFDANLQPHSLASIAALGSTFDCIVRLGRECGNHPIQPGEFEEAL